MSEKYTLEDLHDCVDILGGFLVDNLEENGVFEDIPELDQARTLLQNFIEQEEKTQ